MSLTRKPGKPAASADVNPRKAHNAERENQEQLVSRRSSTAGKTLDQRAKLEHWREQKQLQERNKSAGKVMSTSSRRGKENSILVSTVSRSPVFSRVATVSNLGDFVCFLTSVEHSFRHGTQSSHLSAGSVLPAE